MDKDFDCYMKVDATVKSEDSETFRRCSCLSSCTSVDYTSDVVFERIYDPTDGENISRSSMSIYFGSDEFVVHQKIARLGNVSVLSNVGGLLAFFLGISVLSIVEIFYFFVIRFVNNLWWDE
jgi:acid-sensing ion channel, other